MADSDRWRAWEARSDLQASGLASPDVRARVTTFLTAVLAAIDDLAARLPDATDDDLIAVLGPHVLLLSGPDEATARLAERHAPAELRAQEGHAEPRSVEVKALVSQLVNDVDHQHQLRDDFRRRKVAPAIEALIWQYHLGRPTQPIDVTPSVDVNARLEEEQRIFATLDVADLEELCADSQRLVDRAPALSRARRVRRWQHPYFGFKLIRTASTAPLPCTSPSTSTSMPFRKSRQGPPLKCVSPLAMTCRPPALKRKSGHAPERFDT